MQYYHVYVLNKFEKSNLIQSQALNMLALEEMAIAIFIKEKDTKDSYIHEIMKKYSFKYMIVKNYFEMISTIKAIDGVCLLHAREMYTISLIELVRRIMFRKMKIYTLYDIRGLSYEESIYSSDKILTKLKSKIKEQLIRYAANRADALSTVTGNLKNVICKRYDIPETKPILVIPTCISEDYVRHQQARDEFQNHIRIVYAGGTRFKWHKIEDVIQVMLKIQIDYPTSQLFFLVNDVDESLFKERISKTGLIAEVLHCSNREVVDFLSTTNYGIILRDDNLLNRVAAPTKLSEYLLTGNRILYSGSIGSIDDIKTYGVEDIFIDVDDVMSGKIALSSQSLDIPTDLKNHFLWETNVQKYNDLVYQLTEK